MTIGIPRVLARIEYIEKVGVAVKIEPSSPKQVAIKIERINSSEPLPTEILSAEILTDGVASFTY